MEKAADWYYASNEFVQEFSLGGDTSPARLIRWRSWADFEHGKWQDLSSYIPKDEIPLFAYSLTIRDNVLYTPLSRVRGDNCEEGRILELDLASLPSK